MNYRHKHKSNLLRYYTFRVTKLFHEKKPVNFKKSACKAIAYFGRTVL